MEVLNTVLNYLLLVEHAFNFIPISWPVTSLLHYCICHFSALHVILPITQIWYKRLPHWIQWIMMRLNWIGCIQINGSALHQSHPEHKIHAGTNSILNYTEGFKPLFYYLSTTFYLLPKKPKLTAKHGPWTKESRDWCPK